MLRRIKKQFIFVTAIVTAIGLALPGGKAFASSIYDSYYNTTSTLTVDDSSADCDSTDITNTWATYITDDTKWPTGRSDYSSWESMRTSFQNAINDEDGSWGVSQYTDGGSQYVHVYWSQTDTEFNWYQPFEYVYYKPVTGSATNYARISCQDWGFANDNPAPAVDFIHLGAGWIQVSSSSLSYENLFVHNVDTNLPSGYEGDDIAILNEVDDTDGDGITDFVESVVFPYRNEVFCGTSCAYPDPTEKDVYIEIDWMDSGTTDYKPTTTQLNLVTSMFANENINVHFDTGQYGGGEELSSYTAGLRNTVSSGQADFWDYKNGGDSISAHFDYATRGSIWRYMIAGNQVYGSSSLTGWAEVLGDDIFISMGSTIIDDGEYGPDRGVAGTIAHEIGHLLCLSDEQEYEEHDAACVHEEIDTQGDVDYLSVMNYQYQLPTLEDLENINYSDGTNGAGDHDDWAGVSVGMGAFGGSLTALGIDFNDDSRVLSPSGHVIKLERSHKNSKKNNHHRQIPHINRILNSNRF